MPTVPSPNANIQLLHWLSLSERPPEGSACDGRRPLSEARAQFLKAERQSCRHRTGLRQSQMRRLCGCSGAGASTGKDSGAPHPAATAVPRPRSSADGGIALPPNRCRAARLGACGRVESGGWAGASGREQSGGGRRWRAGGALRERGSMGAGHRAKGD